MAKQNTSLSELILKYHPLAVDCVDEHIGPQVLVVQPVLDDDRVIDMAVPRCGHCWMPVGGEKYVEVREIKDFVPSPPV